MKKVILIAFVMFAGLALTTAQTKKVKEGVEVKKETTPAVKKEVKQSSLEWLNPNANMGEVEHKHPATATYEFINNGDKPVILTNVRTSCGCTSKSYTKEPVQPGKKGKVTATYNAARVGKFTKTITVTTNEEGVAPKRLKITGVVIAKKPTTTK